MLCFPLLLLCAIRCTLYLVRRLTLFPSPSTLCYPRYSVPVRRLTLFPSPSTLCYPRYSVPGAPSNSVSLSFYSVLSAVLCTCSPSNSVSLSFYSVLSAVLCTCSPSNSVSLSFYSVLSAVLCTWCAVLLCFPLLLLCAIRGTLYLVRRLALFPSPSILFYSVLGCVLPLQEVALRQSLPSFSVLCYPRPYRSLLPHNVISLTTFWSSD